MDDKEKISDVWRVVKKVIPSEHIELHVDYPPDVLAKRLKQALVAGGACEALGDHDSLFDGEVSGSGFAIVRVPRDGQTPWCVLEGLFKPLHAGTLVTIQATLSPMSKLMMLVFSAAAIFAFLRGLAVWVLEDAAVTFVFGFIGSGFLAGWVMPRYLFCYAVKRNAALLEAVFSGREADAALNSIPEKASTGPLDKGLAKAVYLVMLAPVLPALTLLLGYGIQPALWLAYIPFYVGYSFYVWFQPTADLVYLSGRTVLLAAFSTSILVFLFVAADKGIGEGIILAAVVLMVSTPKILVVGALYMIVVFTLYKIFVGRGWLSSQ